MLPSLEDLGVRIHSDIRYQDGPSECPGELRVMGVFGKRDEWADLKCEECQASIAVENKRAPDMSWQQRRDLA